jgi:glycosyltransferase involved in cell wall biosynthesis
LQNKEWFADYNIDASSFDWNVKKLWISGIARLRNAQDFLRISIESHLPFFDEIILADNLSEDWTREICQALAQKYPDKIKAIQYPFSTHKLWSDEYKNSTSDSVYDLSYFYNRVLSHVSYSRVAKIDDDHIILPDVMSLNREKILSTWEDNTYYQMLGVNIMLNESEYQIPLKWPFMWLYGDHGFFPLSKETYYIHDDWSENFVHNCSIKYLPISFIHLKYLKDYSKNYQWAYNSFNDIIMQWWSVVLPGLYKKVLSSRGIE